MTTYFMKYYRLNVRGKKYYKFLLFFLLVTVVLISGQYVFA